MPTRVKGNDFLWSLVVTPRYMDTRNSTRPDRKMKGFTSEDDQMEAMMRPMPEATYAWSLFQNKGVRMRIAPMRNMLNSLC